jgi:two-component system response regulator HydG
MKKMDILIVDDDRGFAGSLRNLLAGEGYQIKLEHSGEAAVERSREQDFDITFIDVKLPGIDGFESLHQIREFKPDAKVIMMTAFAEENLLEQALEWDAVPTLRKPLNIDEVLGLLEDVDPTRAILLVDDDPGFVNSVRNVLVEEGYQVFVAVSGEEAVDYARNHDFDILILDLRLPVMNGVDVYRNIKQHDRSVPTIVVTGFASEESESIKELKLMNVTECLVKPFEMDKLLQAVRKLAKTG